MTFPLFELENPEKPHVTTITVVVQKTQQPAPAGVTFAATAVVVTDNSGAVLTAQTLNGSESPPWTATFTGASGTQEASATITDLDTAGNTIGTPLNITETGTGGQTVNFPASTSATISVS